jgi:hypothetical protein
MFNFTNEACCTFHMSFIDPVVSTWKRVWIRTAALPLLWNLQPLRVRVVQQANSCGGVAKIFSPTLHHTGRTRRHV